ncbi:small multi-drug export protein [Romboutsia sedimentorum]|uniref:Small multi-drug export protein n=1 Tax=Romboutsia sedimentorum TaxID=1368474 RepID=A0ABT7E7M6_9FIRM|nr:small multi-drug export protein [Romboutsia sedimentorum]MDK2562936.1 small multi-drug export protein [Romboutsia sedimentorum]MDK2586356.1 small multi-drug export protein [Romboutsia sedimentorum]
MAYLKIMILSMIPITELRGAIPIGIALGLNPIGVYIASVVGSTLVSIPLILTFRHIIHFLRDIKMCEGLVRKVDRKIASGMKKLKNISILGIILFVGVPLPTTGTWTAAAVASILKMRIKDAFLGVLLGNMMAGIIVSALSLHLI